MAGPRRGPPSPRGQSPLSARMRALKSAANAGQGQAAAAGASATYRSADFDYPVTVTGFAGERDGVRHFTIEGSSAAIPESQLVFRAPADMDRILNAQQADPGVEADAASPEGTVLEERTAPPQRQVWTQDDTLRTIDQVHSNSEKILGRMIRDSQLATGNKPQIRPKFAGKTLQPKAEFEQAVAAAIDLRREMAKPNPSVQAAWGHTQKLLQFMRGKEWANEIVPDLSVFEPDAIARAEKSNAESPPRKLPSGLIEEGGDPVRTPVLRGPEDRRNASGQQQYDAVESARKLFDDRLDALRRTIRGTFQGPEYNLTDVPDDVMPPATKAQALERLNKVVRDTLGSDAAGIGLGSGDTGGALSSPRAAVEAIEAHLRRSAPAANQRTSSHRTAPSNELQTYSSPALDADDVGGSSYVLPDGSVIDGDEAAGVQGALDSAKASEEAIRFGERLDRMLGQPSPTPPPPGPRPQPLRKAGAVSLAEADAAAAAESARKTAMAASQPAREVAGTVQRPEVIRQRLAELNAAPAAPDTPLGYETYAPNRSTEVTFQGLGPDGGPLVAPQGISRIEDRIAGRTRDPLPEAPQQEINNIARYAVALEGTPTMPRGGRELQTTNQQMLVQKIANRDGYRSWVKLAPLRAEVRRYGDTFLIISESGQPFEVSAQELQGGGSALPRRIDLTRAREIVASAKREDVQTPRDVDRAFQLYNNQRYRQNWWEYFKALPDERISRQAAEPVRNPGIDVPETNLVTDEAARSAATDLVRQLQSNNLSLSGGGDEAVAPEALATVLSYIARNPTPDGSVAGLLDGPSDDYGRLKELRDLRTQIEARSDISTDEKSELLEGVTRSENEVRFPGRGVQRLDQLLADRSMVRTILGRVLEGNPDAATPMTLYAVDWLRRNAPESFQGPAASEATQAASRIERVVADQYLRPAPDRTGPRPPLGPQAAAWRDRMQQEMGRLGYETLDIFGNLEDRVNLQTQSSRFDDSAMSAGERAGLSGARAGMGPDRRRASGPRPSIEDNPELGMIAREEGDSVESNPRAAEDVLSGASPRYQGLLERAQILAMEAGVDHTGTLGAVLARLNSEAQSDGGLLSQRGRPAELQKLNESVQAMIPREDSSAPGTLASLFGNDEQRQAWAQTLFRGTQEEMEQNMRMLFLTWLNNPLARNAIDRQGKSGVNPFFAAPRQSAEGADLGPIDSSNVEWTMSRLDDLEQQRRELTGGIFQREMEDALVDSKPLIPPHRRNNARLARIDSEIAALKESNPGIFQAYQQFKDEVGNAFRRELSAMPRPGIGDDRPARQEFMQRARGFFGLGDREEGMNLRQMLAGGKPIALPAAEANTRIADLTQLLDSIEAVANSGERGIDPTVSPQESGFLSFMANDPEVQLTDGDLAAIRQVLETGEGELDPAVTEKLRRAGAFGEAILRGDLPDSQLGADPALRKNSGLLSATRTIPISERFEVADEAAGAAKIAEIQSDSTGQYAGLRPSKQLVRENGKLFVEAFKEAPAVRSSLTADFYVPPSGPAIPRSSPTAPAMRDGVVSFGSEMYTPANMPASRLQQIRGLQGQLSFAKTPSEIAPIQAQIDPLERGVRAVDTQGTPTVSSVERQARAGIPGDAGAAVEEQLSRLSEILQAVEDARRRSPVPSNETISNTTPLEIPSAGQVRASVRRSNEPVGPLGRLELDEATLAPLTDSLLGSGFYVEPNTPGANLVESIAGLRRPVTAEEITDPRSALAAEPPRAPEEVARMALQRLASAELEGRRLGIDITDMAFDDPDLPQRLQNRAQQFRQLAEESKAEAGGAVDDNSSYLEAVASKFEEAARTVNQGYISSRADRGVADDMAPGRAIGSQSGVAQPRVSLGGGSGSAFFRGGDGKMYLRANVEGGRPLFIPIRTGDADAETGKAFSPNYRVDERGRLQRIGPALRENSALPQAPRREIPEGGPQKPPASAFEYENMQQYFEDPQAPDLGEPQIDDMGAGIPGMGAPVAMNAAPGDTNTYVNDPEAVLRRLRQSVRPAAVMA